MRATHLQSFFDADECNPTHLIMYHIKRVEHSPTGLRLTGEHSSHSFGTVHLEIFIHMYNVHAQKIRSMSLYPVANVLLFKYVVLFYLERLTAAIKSCATIITYTLLAFAIKIQQTLDRPANFQRLTERLFAFCL